MNKSLSNHTDLTASINTSSRKTGMHPVEAAYYKKEFAAWLKEASGVASSSHDSSRNKKIVREFAVKKVSRKAERNKTRDVKKLFQSTYEPQGGWMDYLTLKHEVSLDPGVEQDIHAIAESLREGVTLEVDFVSKVASILESAWRFCKELALRSLNLAQAFVFGIIECFTNTKIAAMIGGLFSALVPTSESIIPQSFGTDVFDLLHHKFFKDWIPENEWAYLAVSYLRNWCGKNVFDKCNAYLLFFSEILNTLALKFGLTNFVPTPFCVDKKMSAMYERLRAIRDLVRSDKFLVENVQVAIYALEEDVERAHRDEKNHALRDKYMLLLTEVKKIVTFVDNNLNTANGPRLEPVGICIAGATGSGKSTFTMPIIQAVLAMTLEGADLEAFENNPNDFMFFRNNENEFWDGYRQKHVAIIYDDFGQRKDTAGVDNLDAFEIIRAINTAPFHLHMSSITDKQKYYARPQFVMATTNLNRFKFQSIVSNAAVVRRFHIKYVQVPKEEFSVDGYKPNDIWSRVLDVDKVRRKYPAIEDDPFTFAIADVLEFHPWDFLNGAPVYDEEVLSFGGLIQKIYSVHQHHQKRGNMMLDFHRHIRSLYARKDGSAQERFPVVPQSGGGDRIQQHMGVETIYCEDHVDSDDGVCDHTHEIDKSLDACWEENSWDNFLDFPTTRTNIRTSLNILLTRAAKSWWVNPLTSSKRDIVSAVCYAVGGVTLLLKTWESLRAGFDFVLSIFQLDVAQSSVAKSNNDKVNKVKKGIRTRYARTKVVHPQSGSTHNTDFLLKLLKKNMYDLYVADERLGMVTFIRGTTFVMPAHFEMALEKHATEDGCVIMSFRNIITGRVCFEVDWMNDTEALREQFSDETPIVDMTMVRIHDHLIRKHGDITDSFPREGLLNRSGDKFECLMPVRRANTIMFLNPVVSVGNHHEYTLGGCKFSSQDLEYTTVTMPGDCGGLLVTNDSRCGRPTILGFHTGARRTVFTKNVPVSSPCVGVSFDVGMVEDMFSLGEEEWKDLAEVVPESGCKDILRKAKQPRLGENTKICHSRLYGSLWPTVTAPCHLRVFEADGVAVDPVLKAKEKYFHDELYVDSGLLHAATKVVSELMLCNRVPQPWSPRLLTFHEAIDGVSGVEFVESINRSTSSGYPWCLVHSKKRHWLGEVGEFSEANDNHREIRMSVDNIIDKAKKNVRTEVIYVDCLKDERKPIEKVNLGKTRQFMVCPLDYLIAVKMYFGDWIRYVCTNRIRNGCALGIDPFSEWHVLATHLRFSKNILCGAGDYSSFDCKQRASVSLASLSIIERYYCGSEEDARVRRVLFEDFINSRHINSGEIYELFGGNPSGNALTTIVNSMNGLIMFSSALAWLLDEHAREESLEDILLLVKVVVFGDDIIFSYPRDLHRLLNQENMTKAMKAVFDIDYTSETKDGVVHGERLLSDVTFLKRGFRYDRGTWFCPLDITVLRETLNWQRKDTTVLEFEQRIECVLVELALHGKAVFIRDAPVIVRAAQSVLGYYPKCSTYDAALSSRTMYSLAEN